MKNDVNFLYDPKEKYIHSRTKISIIFIILTYLNELLMNENFLFFFLMKNGIFLP